MSDRHVVYNQADYLSFEALEDGFMLSFPQELRYSVNGGVWKNLPYNVYTEPINSGDIISLQGDCEISTYEGIGIFNLNKKCNVLGNILSITGYKILRSWQFRNLFKNCTIVDGGNLILPATELANSCYESMFYDCTSLVSAPELPATTLSESCYNSMFKGCTSLVNAPELPATELAINCYNSMFGDCVNLNYIKMLATDISAYGCLNSWVQGVSPTGTFVKSKDATWDVIGDSGVPTGWTVITDDQEGEGGDSGSGLEFPIYLTFDSCEESHGLKFCTRAGDETSVNLYNYIVEIVAEYGENIENVIIVSEQILSLLGVEIYIEGEKVSSVTYSVYAYSMETEGDYYYTVISDDGSLNFEG